MKKVLKEASFKVSMPTYNLVAYYGTWRVGSSIPGVIVMSESIEVPVSESQEYRLILTKPRSLKKRYEPGYGDDWTIAITTLLELSYASSYEIYNDIENNIDIYMYDEHIKVTDWMTREETYRYMTSNMSMPKHRWVDDLGEVPEMAHDTTDEVVSYQGANIIFPTNSQSRTKKNGMQLITQIHSILSNHNLAWLFDRIEYVFVKSIPGKTVGTYEDANKHMRIEIRNKYPGRVLLTLAHEFGHALYKTFENDRKREVISQYLELRKTFRYDARVNTESLERVLQSAVPGAKVVYKGRKRDLKQLNPLVINDRDKWEDGGKTLTMRSEAPHFSRYEIVLSGPPRGFAGKDWEVNGYTYEPVSEDVKFDVWFPTKYSYQASGPAHIQHNAEEWFCEILSYYLADKLLGEPMQWIGDFIKRPS